MAILNVRKYPDEVLKQVAKPVEDFSPDLETLANNMLETMYDAPGIGLAAPQVGESVRLIVVDIRNVGDDGVFSTEHLTELESQIQYPLRLVNPVVVHSEGKTTFEEACLSVPGFSENVQRAEYIEVEATSVTGEKLTLKTDGLLAICIQHEIDHLDGKLFIDRLSTIKRSMIKSKIKKHGYADDAPKHLL